MTSFPAIMLLMNTATGANRLTHGGPVAPGPRKHGYDFDFNWHYPPKYDSRPSRKLQPGEERYVAGYKDPLS